MNKSKDLSDFLVLFIFGENINYDTKSVHIKGYNIEDVKAYFEKHFAPNYRNATIVHVVNSAHTV